MWSFILHYSGLVGPEASFWRGSGTLRPMARDVLFVLDPVETLDPWADSSYVMIAEALRRGHRPFATELRGLSVQGSRAYAYATRLHVGTPGSPIKAQGPAIRRELGEFAVILMRKDPPVDDGYITATWILNYAPKNTLVINDPAGLRDINEKLSILHFPNLIPETLVSRSAHELRAFLAELGGKMIVKPVYGFGGREILMARENDPNLGSILELATRDGTRWTVAQAYLPEAVAGDKRILLVEGHPIGAVLRVPAAGELRNNFHTGGTPVISELTAEDRAICSAVGPFLLAHGQFFAGIDVIGDRLTEINVTSPTGMQEINRLRGLSGDATMEAQFWAALESKLGGGERS